MKKLFLVVATTFIVGCLAGAATSTFVVPHARAGTNPQKWEYSCFGPAASADTVTKQANQLGGQGWEMVATGQQNWCFKRPLP